MQIFEYRNVKALADLSAKSDSTLGIPRLRGIGSNLTKSIQNVSRVCLTTRNRNLRNVDVACRISAFYTSRSRLYQGCPALFFFFSVSSPRARTRAITFILVLKRGCETDTRLDHDVSAQRDTTRRSAPRSVTRKSDGDGPRLPLQA